MWLITVEQIGAAFGAHHGARRFRCTGGCAGAGVGWTLGTSAVVDPGHTLVAPWCL